MLRSTLKTMAGRQAHGVSVGPRTMRFLRQEAAAGGKAEVAAERSYLDQTRREHGELCSDLCALYVLRERRVRWVLDPRR
jgi:hypothetical protein